MAPREITPVIFFGTDNRFLDEDLSTLPQFGRLKDYRPTILPADTPVHPKTEARDVVPKAFIATAPVLALGRDSNGNQATLITPSLPENPVESASVAKGPNGTPDLIPPLGS